MNKPRRDLRPDAQGFDEVRLVTVPRWKDSYLSGSEWRISIKAQYFRKGRMLFEESISHKMDDAASFMGWKYTCACEGTHQYYAGEENWCDQEGCAEQATVTYRKKFDWCQSGHKTETIGIVIRKFCDKHKTRGDCGLDDSDSNYELFEDVPQPSTEL